MEKAHNRRVTSRTLYSSLLRKIKNKRASIAILGTGYLGHELGFLAAKKGFTVVGITHNLETTRTVQTRKHSRFSLSPNPSDIGLVDLILITVSTLIDAKKRPLLSPLKEASRILQKHLKKGQLVILESTVSPGMTQKWLIDPLKKTGLRCDVDYFLGYSPDRIDPGNSKYTLENIPKIVSGNDAHSLALTKCFYDQIVAQTVPVSSVEVAEFAKMMENVVRFVLINLMNELQTIATSEQINLWEVIKAAATKPFGWFPVYPSAGVGGHCIPVNLHYLLQDAKRLGLKCPILNASVSAHERRIRAIVNQAFKLSKRAHPHIFIVGVSIKPGSRNTANSVGLKMLHLIEQKGGVGSYHDPLVPCVERWVSQPLTKKNLHGQNVFVIVTEQEGVNWNVLALTRKPILDAKNVMRNYTHAKVIFV